MEPSGSQGPRATSTFKRPAKSSTTGFTLDTMSSTKRYEAPRFNPFVKKFNFTQSSNPKAKHITSWRAGIDPPAVGPSTTKPEVKPRIFEASSASKSLIVAPPKVKPSEIKPLIIRQRIGSFQPLPLTSSSDSHRDVSSSSTLKTRSPVKSFSATSLISRDDREEERYCSTKTCRALLSGYHKTCEKCRTKSRENSRRRRERLAALGRDISSTPPPAGNVAAYTQETYDDKWEMMSRKEKLSAHMSQLLSYNATTLGKRKAEDVLEMDSKKRKVVVDYDPCEYQNARALYTDMRAVLVQSAGSPWNFAGHFSTVQALHHELSYSKMQSDVQRMARKAGLKLGDHPVVLRKSSSSLNGHPVFRLECRCACYGGCGGKVYAKLEKVVDGVVPGERLTVKVKH